MYGKIFASLYQGTLRGRSNEILVFTNLIACATQAGTADKHWRAIAEETGITVEAVKEAITNLEAPDPESRSTEAQGARIVRLDGHREWGWQIVNYGKYRGIRSEEDRNAYMRDYMANRRKSQCVNDRLTPVKPCKPQLAQAEGEAEAEGEAKAEAPEKKTVRAFALSPDGEQQPKAKREKFTPPTPEEAKLHAEKIGLPSWEVDKFIGYYESNGWRVGKNPMKNWQAAMVNWRGNWEGKGRPGIGGPSGGYHNPVSDARNAAMGLDTPEKLDEQGRKNAELARRLAA